MIALAHEPMDVATFYTGVVHAVGYGLMLGVLIVFVVWVTTR